MIDWRKFAAHAALGAGCFMMGYAARKPTVDVRTIEVTKWQTKTETVVVKSANVEKKQATRVVTRWFSMAGHVTKEATSETASQSSSATAATVAKRSDASGETARVSESRTARPTWALGAIGGFDLRLKSRPWFGAYAQRQVIGPVNAGVFVGTGGHVGLTLGVRW